MPQHKPIGPIKQSEDSSSYSVNNWICKETTAMEEKKPEKK